MITLSGLFDRWRSRRQIVNLHKNDAVSNIEAMESRPVPPRIYPDMDLDPGVFEIAENLSSQFIAIKWAQGAINGLYDVYNVHCSQLHRDVFECDYLCFPKPAADYLNSLNENNLRALFIVVFKAWYWRQHVMLQWATRNDDNDNDR